MGWAWGRLGRQVFAGAGDGQLAMLHALGGNEFIGDALDDVALLVSTDGGPFWSGPFKVKARF